MGTYTSETGRYIECLQVGVEQVMIELRPAFISLHGNLPVTNKWLEISHWNELYEILSETATIHIQTTKERSEPQIVNGCLVKVLYQFQPRNEFYLHLAPYEYHSGDPILALKSDGLDSVPSSYYPSCKNERHSEEKRGTVSPCSSYCQDKTGGQGSRDEDMYVPRPSPNTSQESTLSTSNFAEGDTSLSDDETGDIGASPVWCHEESAAPVIAGCSDAVLVLQEYLHKITPIQENDSEETDSQDLFADCDGASSNYQESTFQIEENISCPTKGSNCFASQERKSTSPPMSPRIDTLPSDQHDTGIDQVPKKRIKSPTSTSSGKSVVKITASKRPPKNNSEPTKTEVNFDFCVSENESSQSSCDKKLREKRKQSCNEETVYKVQESNRKLQRRAKKGITKARSAACETDDRSRKEQSLEASKVKSFPGKVRWNSYRDLNDVNHTKNSRQKQKPPESELDVKFVDSTPPLTDQQRILYEAHLRGGKKGYKLESPIQSCVSDVEVESLENNTITFDCIGSPDQSPTSKQKTLSRKENTVNDADIESSVPSDRGMSHSDSDDVTGQKTTVLKHNRSFSKFDDEQEIYKSSQSFTSSFEESIQLNAICKTNSNEDNCAESMPSTSSKHSSEHGGFQASRTSHRNRNVVCYTETTPHKKTTSNAKIERNQQPKQSPQMRKQKTSTRKPTVGSFTESEDLSKDEQPQEVAIRRTSPRKIKKCEAEAVSTVEGKVDINDEQSNLVEMYKVGHNVYPLVGGGCVKDTKKKRKLLSGSSKFAHELFPRCATSLQQKSVVPLPESENLSKDEQAQEVAIRRTSPRKINKREAEPVSTVVEKHDEFNEEQRKLLEMYKVGENNASPMLVSTKKNQSRLFPGHGKFALDNAQKRVNRKSKTPLAKRKKGMKGASSSQISDYFVKTKPDNAATDKAGTFASTSMPNSNMETKWLNKFAEVLVVPSHPLGKMTKIAFSSDEDSDSSGNSNGPLHVLDKSLVTPSRETDEENARFVERIENLSLEKITKIFKKTSSVYHGIFKERIHCERHNKYKAGGEERNNLRYSTSTNPFSDEQLTHMMHLLTSAFCQENPIQFVDYMWKVLIPELANQVFMDEFNLDPQESLEKIHELYIFSRQSSD